MAAAKTATDKKRCGYAESRIDWHSIGRLNNDATWLTDLRQSGKSPVYTIESPVNTIESKVRPSRGWITSHCQPCTTVMGGPKAVRWMRDRDFNTPSTTRPASPTIAVRPGLESASSG